MPSLVSVIIPVHNRSDLLYECLASVRAQTYPHIEVIVVDDASSEPIESVTQSIDWGNGFRCKYLRLDHNQGPGAARERGRREASGDFIAYLDSDDLWFPAFVEKSVTALLANPNAGMSYTGSLVISEHPSDPSAWLKLPRDHPIQQLLPATINGKNWISTPVRLWTRRTTDMIGPWITTRRSQDVNYSLRAACFDIEVCPISEPLVYIRENHSWRQKEKQDALLKKTEMAKSLLHAGHHLEQHGKLDIVTNALSFAHLMFDIGQSLLLLGENDYSSQCLKAALQISPRMSSIRTAAWLVHVSTLFWGPYTAGRIARRLKYSVLSQLSGYYD